MRRFLAAVPPLEQKQCLRAALIHGVRHFLNLQSQGVVLNTASLRGALAAFAPAPSQAARAQNLAPSVLRRDSQPGSGLTAFPFVDESRFQSAEESVADGVAPAPRTETSVPDAPLSNAVFGSYPNWWPLNNVVKASEAAAEATRQAAAPEKENVDEKNQRSSDRTSPEKSEKQPPDASEQEKGNPPGSARTSKKPEVIVAIPGRRDIDAKRRQAERGTKDDGLDLAEPVAPAPVPKFRARKAPPRRKAPSNGGGGSTARRLRKVKSKIGAEVKAYRAAARRAKINQNAAMESVMASYADRSKLQRRGESRVNATLLANAVIESGVVADLLAEAPGPSVEVYALPRPEGTGRVGIVEESRRTFSDIMNEIELAAQAEDVERESARAATGGHGSGTRKNYSDWVGDFGPPHTRSWRSVGAKHVDGDVDASMEAVERAAAGELEAKF